MLRRITASPYPVDVDDARSSSRSEEESEPSVQPVQAVHNPLYMALGDALAKPYSHHSVSQPSYVKRSGHRDSTTEDQYPLQSAHENRHDDPHHIRPPSPVISAPRSLECEGAYSAVPTHFPERRVERDFPSIGSDLSSILSEEHRLSEGDTSISGAAEELFKNLSGAGGFRAIAGAYSHDLSGLPSNSQYIGTTDSTTQQHQPTEALWDNTGPMPPTWRETLTEDAYQALLAHYDIFEMRRQEVIWELCRSEEEFVELLQTTLTLFVQPLRTENDTRWIPGLDAGVAKLFDWLDDIAQLHADVLAIMQGCRTNQVRLCALSLRRI